MRYSLTAFRYDELGDLEALGAMLCEHRPHARAGKLLARHPTALFVRIYENGALLKDWQRR